MPEALDKRLKFITMPVHPKSGYNIVLKKEEKHSKTGQRIIVTQHRQKGLVQNLYL